MENVDDIFKKMNAELNKAEAGLAPRIVQQKEDVVYIKNAPQDWQFNRVLTFGNQQAVTLCLQEQQAIALLMQRSGVAADGNAAIAQQDHLKTEMQWGSVMTASGQNISKEQSVDSGEKTEIDLVKRVDKASYNRTLVSE